MRLIDADAFYSELEEIRQDYLEEDTNSSNFAAEVIETVQDEYLSNAPTIEAEPVRHGEWKDKPTGAYGRMQSWCTACGKHSGIGGIESNRHKPYCPNCGAKMDGDKK